MSKEASAWMPFYIGDYLGDTQRLTTEQHGAYLLLILDYWRNGPAPDDDAVLQQITKLDKVGWKRCRPALSRLFQIADGEWRHKRIEKELAKAQANAERRSEKASKAAQARWGESPKDAGSNAPSMPQALLGECPPQSPSSEANASSAGEGLTDLKSGVDLADLTSKISNLAGVPISDWGDAARSQAIVQGWLDAGADPAFLSETVASRKANTRSQPKSLQWFDGAVREAILKRRDASSALNEATGSIIDRVLGRNAA